MTISFEVEALEEYEEAAQYAEDKFGLGRAFVAAVRSALTTIAQDPGRFPSVGQDIRIFRMKRFPFYLFYHYAEQEALLTIYAVAHHKRQSDYWRGRVSE